MRLFWKFFFAFFLAQFSIFLITASIVITGLENNRLSPPHQRVLTHFAYRKIQEYENFGITGGENLTQPGFRPRFERGRRFLEGNGIRILSGDEIIYEINPEMLNEGGLISFPLEGANGHEYIVQTRRPPPPRIIVDGLKRITFLQFFLILAVSVLLSVIFSFSISRPLTRLGQASRKYAEEGGEVEFERSVLKRGDEIGELAKDLQFMIAQVEKHSQSQQQLLHDVSHELRAPLARLQTCAGLMEKQFGESAHLNRVHTECEKINALIQKILDFSRLNQRTYSAEEFSPADLLVEQVENIGFTCPGRKINLSITEQDGSLKLHGYPELLATALENIVGNCCKHTPSDKAIDIALSSSDTSVVIRVRDYGPGVDEKDLTQLAQPFYRAQASESVDGFGLGLSIAGRAVEKHGGKLQFANAQEGGLVVTIELPRSSLNAN
ncbi:sensor histidine kinase [Teredinibacter sp. KSP-S5-2]|uniref:sensor histidine kinase n=1 Tax=Teredinibacter sp. KSP-S5-2 TaxID=3034506 RepID=UPI0029352D70|nr:ATP-binding protein [Teredinibacter sp. KSP-S5-2]WNO08471.1 ATP-binding protein [Teredinibacter sp. KSP-S5-2]